MPFWSDIQCAGNSGCKDMEAQALYNNIARQLQAHINVSCSPQDIAVQNTTCSVLANKCPGLNVSCTNTVNQHAACDLPQLIDSTVSTLVSTLDPAALRKALALDPDASANDVKNAVGNQLTKSCGSENDSYQTVTANVVCKMAADVNLNYFANVDQSSGCAITEALALAMKAHPAKSTSAKRTRGILYIVCFAVVYVLLLLLIVLFMQSNVKPPSAPPQIVAA